MRSSHPKQDLSLVGIGLYTPADAQRLLGIPSNRIVRWLRGHNQGGRVYEALWTPQVDLGDGQTYLGFLDLVQARVAAALIEVGLSPQKVRRAIVLAREIVATDRPFASALFRTDGKTLLLQSLAVGEDDRLIDLFSGGQFVMREILEPSLKGLEFEHDLAARWWPTGRSAGIVIDPRRQFGQPIDDETGVPTAILARAVQAEGSVEKAAQAFMVPPRSVRRAMTFEQLLAA